MAASRLCAGLPLVLLAGLGWAAEPSVVPALHLPTVVGLPTIDDDHFGGSIVVVAPGTGLTLLEAFPHPVAAGESVTLVLPGGGRRTATVVAIGSRTTAVRLDFDTTGLGVQPLADPHTLTLGSPVWTIGNSTGALVDDGAPAVSRGTVSGRYDLPADGPPVRGRGGRILSTYHGPVLEIDAAVNDGNQGGAVVDPTGNLIGLASLATARERRLGTAIPLDLLLADVGLPPATTPANGSPAVPPPPGLALVAFDRPDGLGNPDSVPRPTKTPEQVPVYDRDNLVRWWDAYFHSQQIQWTDSPSPALLIDPGQGLLLTAASHLHGGATTGRLLQADGTTQAVTVVAVDAPLDLALLRAAGPVAAPGARIATTAPQADAQVAVVARHLVTGEPTRTTGHVSCLGRRLDQADIGFLQIDARANYASLGGAVVDRENRIIGLVVRSGPETPWLINSGVTLALDGATIARVLPALLAGTSRARLPTLGLGVVLEPDGDALVIQAVIPGTGAEAAKLLPGDVLTAVDGLPAWSRPAVTRALLRHRAGERIPVVIKRTGRPLAVTIELREFGAP
jgi:putative serine protease PepD